MDSSCIMDSEFLWHLDAAIVRTTGGRQDQSPSRNSRADMIRRTFLASLSGSALALSPAQSNFEHRETAGEVILGNGVLRLTFDRASGALVRLENRPAGKLLAIAPSAAAPVRLWLGSRTHPDEAVLKLARSVSQKCHWQTVEVDGELLNSWSTTKTSLSAVAALALALTQTYTISPKSDVVRLQTTIENQGAWWITGVFLGLESLSLNAEASRERLVTGGVSSAPHGPPSCHTCRECVCQIPVWAPVI